MFTPNKALFILPRCLQNKTVFQPWLTEEYFHSFHRWYLCHALLIWDLFFRKWCFSYHCISHQTFKILPHYIWLLGELSKLQGLLVSHSIDEGSPNKVGAIQGQTTGVWYKQSWDPFLTRLLRSFLYMTMYHLPIIYCPPCGINPQMEYWPDHILLGNITTS